MDRTRIPADIKQVVTRELGGEELRLALSSDLEPAGNFREEWLVASDTRLLVLYSDDGQVTVRFSTDLEPIAEIKARNLAGSGVVEVETGGITTRILSFSMAKATDIHQAVEVIKKLKDKQEITREDIASRRKRCEECGKPIPQGHMKCPHCLRTGQALGRLLKFSKPYAWQLAGLFLLTLASAAVGLAPPQIVRVLIDSVFKDTPDGPGVFPLREWHLPLVGVMFAIYILQQVFAGLQERVGGIVGFKTVYDVRAAIYEKLQMLSLSFFDKHQTGSLVARVNQDTAEVQVLLVDLIPMALEAVFVILGVGVVLFILSWQLTLYVLIPLLGIFIFIKAVYPIIRAYFHRYYHRRARLSAMATDSLSGIRVIKAFGQEPVEIDKFDSRSSMYRDAGIALVRRWSIFHPAMHLLIMIGTGVVWLVGGRLIFKGLMTVGSVVAYVHYLMLFYRPFFMMTRMASYITSALAASDRVFEVIDTELEVEDSPDAIPMPEGDGSIELRDIEFGYDKHKPVIKGISAKVAPRERVGLVGKSGVGKSTLINLCCRLYDVDKGAILVNGVDIRKIKYADLRKQIGVVLQETFLFNGTIYDNIAYANPAAACEEIIDAAKAANAHDFIVSKPDGYDTEVGERGGRLSGGEKQRIAIARAILRSPSILILDEATSSVDVQTEKQIHEALKHLTRNRTTIAIAHRLSTLRDCHRLFVLEDGKIVEKGTHEELIARKGAFHKLASVQEDLSRIIAIDG